MRIDLGIFSVFRRGAPVRREHRAPKTEKPQAAPTAPFRRGKAAEKRGKAPVRFNA